MIESQMKCATPRNQPRSKGIGEDTLLVALQLLRCIVALEGTGDGFSGRAGGCGRAFLHEFGPDP